MYRLEESRNKDVIYFGGHRVHCRSRQWHLLPLQKDLGELGYDLKNKFIQFIYEIIAFFNLRPSILINYILSVLIV